MILAKNIGLFFIALFISSFTAFCQNKLSLDDAKNLLRKNNTNIKQAALREKITSIELDQAYDALIPNVGFSLGNQNTMGLNFDQVTGQLITGNQWTHGVNTSLSSGITLFQGFREINTIRLNKVNLNLSKLDTERLKYELELQLISLFYQTLINFDLYQVSKEQIKSSTELVKSEGIKIEYGKSTILDLAQAKSKLANDQLNETNSKNAYDLSIFKFKQLLEINTEEPIELIKPTLLSELFIYSTPYTVTSNDPYLKIINTRIDQSIINTKLAKASYFPTINFNTGYGTTYSSQRFTSAFSTTVMPMFKQLNNNRSLYLNLSLSYAIFDGFKTKKNVLKSTISTENLTLEREKVIRERLQNYQQSQLELKAAIEENKAIESAYETSKMNYNAMRERFDVGKSSSIDLFKALTDFNMNEFRKITAKYNLILKQEIIKMQLNFQ